MESGKLELQWASRVNCVYTLSETGFSCNKFIFFIG